MSTARASFLHELATATLGKARGLQGLNHHTHLHHPWWGHYVTAKNFGKHRKDLELLGEENWYMLEEDNSAWVN